MCNDEPWPPEDPENHSVNQMCPKTCGLCGKGLLPYYIISYNKQGSFQMITEDYNKGPRVVRKDDVLWKIQKMPSFSVAHSSPVLR